MKGGKKKTLMRIDISYSAFTPNIKLSLDRHFPLAYEIISLQL